MDVYFDLKLGQTTSINIRPNLNTPHTRNKRRPSHEKVKVGKRQDIAQSERNTNSKTESVAIVVLFAFSAFVAHICVCYPFCF